MYDYLQGATIFGRFVNANTLMTYICTDDHQYLLKTEYVSM